MELPNLQEAMPVLVLHLDRGSQTIQLETFPSDVK